MALLLTEKFSVCCFPGSGLNAATPTGSKGSPAGPTCLNERSTQLSRPGEIQKQFSYFTAGRAQPYSLWLELN